MNGRVAALAVATLVLAPAALRAQGPPMSDVVVLENGRIWTNDPARPEAAGLVIEDGRVVRVLGEGETVDADAWARLGRSVRRIDLHGRRVVPGFNDAHTHFFGGASTLLQPNTLETDTPEEFVRRLEAYAATLPPGAWIHMEAAWDHERWPGHPLPSRALIDSVTGDHPTLLSRPDGHIQLANSLALERAGIDRDTPDPSGGQIDRDPATGEPTGILRDAAGLVARAIPPPSEAELRQILDAGLEHAARLGVTTLQDMCYDPGPIEIRLLQEYERTGRLTARFFCRSNMLTDWKNPASVGITAGYGDRWVRMGSLKAFADGALGSTTAYMFEPYEGQPDNRGLLNDVMRPSAKFLGLAMAADSAHLQLSVHAIGDAAISLVLDQFEKVRAANPAWDRRWRIEHAQHMAPKDFARMADLGVIASVQPYHAIDDGRWAERKIGHERAKTTYAFRTFLDSGVRLAFGTDWPVAPLNPWKSVYGAVTRRTLDGKHPDGWIPGQKITLDEALAAYTSGSAYAEFAEGWKGRLAPGYVADLVALSEDPWAIPPERLDEVESVMTMVGGRVVWAADDLAGEAGRTGAGGR